MLGDRRQIVGNSVNYELWKSSSGHSVIMQYLAARGLMYTVEVGDVKILVVLGLDV